MRFTIFLLLIASLALAGTLSPELEQELLAQPDGLLSVVVFMAERPAEVLATDFGTALSKDQRRELRLSALHELAERTQAPLRSLLHQPALEGRTEDIRSLTLLNAVALRADTEIIRILSEQPCVEEIALSYDSADALCGVSETADLVWGVDIIGADTVWNDLGYTGVGTVVAIVDDGCDIEHPDLADHVWVNPGEVPDNGLDDDDNGHIDDIYGWDFWAHNNTIRGDSGNHGSHTAGTALGDGTNGTQTGVAPDALLMSVKTFSDDGRSTEYIVWDGMEYAAEMGADVISCSFGWKQSQTSNQTRWRELCENIVDLGVVIVAASGNEGDWDDLPAPNNIRTPGDVPCVITVGATDVRDNIANWSSYGPVEWDFDSPYNDHPHPPGLIKPDIAAPGVGIMSLYGHGTGYHILSGTSMAAPHVAGAVALLLSAVSELTPAEVRSYLEESALELGDIGKDNYYGAGRLQADLAATTALTGLRFADFSLSQNEDGITLNWEITKPSEIDSFHLLRRTAGEDWHEFVTLNPTSTSYLDAGVSWDSEYSYLIEAELPSGSKLSKGPETTNYGQGMRRPRPELGYAHPSPASATVTLPIEVPIAGEFTVSLYDLAGRLVETVHRGSLTAGRHNLTIAGDELASGIYIAQLIGGGATLTRRFVIAR
ncbi:S8 family peptidase [bacterium]|nr:S8 family peptidase [bacterium]